MALPRYLILYSLVLTFFADDRLFGTVAIPAAREVLIHDALLVALEVEYLCGRRAQVHLPLHLLLLFFCGGGCGGGDGGRRGWMILILLIALGAAVMI